MLKEEKRKKSKKAWDKTRKRQTNNRLGKGRKNKLSDYDENNFPRVKKEKKKNRIDWQELLLEEDYNLNDG